MPGWKYKVLRLTSPISEEHLKRMGAQGLELAGCVTQTYQETKVDEMGGYTGTLTKFIYYFKRPE